MTPEPRIGATLSPRARFSTLRGLVFALLLGSVGLAVPLGLSAAFKEVRNWLAPPPSVPTLQPRTWELRIPWVATAVSLGWTGALFGFLHFAPGERSPLLQSIRIAVVCVLVAVLADSFVFRRWADLADDPDQRIRVTALAGISVTLAMTTRNSEIWRY